ncbi:Klotho, partial [Frankliniella fusca]
MAESSSSNGSGGGKDPCVCRCPCDPPSEAVPAPAPGPPLGATRADGLGDVGTDLVVFEEPAYRPDKEAF